MMNVFSTGLATILSRGRNFREREAVIVLANLHGKGRIRYSCPCPLMVSNSWDIFGDYSPLSFLE